MHSSFRGLTDSRVPQPTASRRSLSGNQIFIIVEADGPTDAMLEFVNARRAVGGKPAVTLTGSALLAEFRMQPALDFYLTGQRLGNLRRYAEAGMDLFPPGSSRRSRTSTGACTASSFR